MKPLSVKARSVLNLLLFNLAPPAAALLLYGVVFPLLRRVLRIPTVCLTKLLLGIYCPGCGGTRALEALLRLDFVGALRYHAAVPVGALLMLGVDAWAAAAYLRGVPDPFASDRARCTVKWLAAGFGFFLAVYFVIRNLLLLWGIDLPGDLLPA